MRCANSPVTKPESTSPEPAVANHGGALELIAARPSGAAITVSVPLRTMIAPDRSAATRARSSFEPGSSPKSRLNSPSCGVITTGACRAFIAENSNSGPAAASPLRTKKPMPASARGPPRSSFANDVSASASSTTAAEDFRIARTSSAVSGPTEAPGPMSTALRRISPRKSARAWRPGNGAHHD